VRSNTAPAALFEAMASPGGRKVHDRSGVVWVKSSKCEASSCVEVADIGHAVLVRNSSFPDGEILEIPRRDWGAFVAGILDGEFAGSE